MGRTMKGKKILGLACFGLVAVLVFRVSGSEPESAGPAAGSDQRTARGAGEAGEPAAQTPAAARPRMGAGLRAYVDPATGRLVVPPPEKRGDLELAPELRQALETSHQGLTEVVRPDGSASVHLQGRFQSAVFATVDEDGRLRTGHDPALLPPPPREGDE